MNNNAIYSLRGVYALKFYGFDEVYVGATSCTFGERFDQHLSVLKGGRHSNKKLQHLFNERGAAKFEMFVLETSVTSKKELIRSEKRWTKALNRIYPSINARIGGRMRFNKKPSLYYSTSPKPIFLAKHLVKPWEDCENTFGAGI
jgi:hypothetical protein